LQAVYEAGYFGFRLHDRLVAHGIPYLVTPPSLVPQEYGNRVKTDCRDSSKLAHLLAKGMLKRVWVPSEEELYHRQVIRRRRQLVRDRVRTQSRIKAELRFFGVHLEEPRGGPRSTARHCGASGLGTAGCRKALLVSWNSMNF